MADPSVLMQCDRIVYVDTLEEAIQCVTEHEVRSNTRFPTKSVTKHFGETAVNQSVRYKVYWDQENRPYIVLGYKVIVCHHGPDKNKKKRKEMEKVRKKDEACVHTYAKKKTRYWTQPTKKLDCPAKIVMKEILVFPDNATEDTRKRTRQDIASTIRQDIKKGKRQIMVIFSNTEHEHHPVGEAAGLSQRVDISVAKKINEMATEDGVLSVDEMRRHISSYVTQAVTEKPSGSNRRFHPTKRTIRYHMTKAANQEQKGADDQEHLLNLLQERKQEHPDDLIFIRAKKNDINGGQCEAFLMVYQSKWMKGLMKKYGNAMTLLDSTYKTTRFTLPLFFLAVKTNVDHQVVATFLPENESSDSIKEAIGIIKANNPEWTPCHYMTDNDEKEISAMEFHFPEAKGLLCDFHRAQAWSRWIRQAKRGITQKREVLNSLQRFANAGTELEFNSQLVELRRSEHWRVIGEYLEKYWLPNKQKWAQYCRNGELMVGVNTNNGLERLHGTFKQQFLLGKTRMTLTSMVRIMLNKFFPDKRQSYTEDNLLLTGKFKKYADDIPAFLHGRPVKFIEHCMNKMGLAKQCEPHSYNVSLGDPDGFPRCSCPNFCRTVLPCKHIFRAILNSGKFQWELLPLKYRNSPFLTADEEVLGPNEDSTVITDQNVVEQDDLTQHYDVHLNLNELQTDVTVEPSVVTLQKSMREQLDLLRTNSYEMTDKDQLLQVTSALSLLNDQLRTHDLQLQQPMPKRRPSLKLRRKKPGRRLFFENVDDSTVDIGVSESKEPAVIEDDITQDITPVLDTVHWTDEQGGKVKKLWELSQDSHVPVAKVHGACVTDTDIRSLCGTEWLTDNVIDTYLKMLTVELEDEGMGRNLCLLRGYKFVVGAYNRASHWTLVVLDIEKEVIYYYNPVAEAEAAEMASIKSSMCRFIAKCNNEHEANVATRWKSASMAHTSQTDSYNCGVYCLIFAEKHMKEQFQDLIRIHRPDLTDMRMIIACKMMMFEVFVTDCCPKCGFSVEEQDEKVECAVCSRSYHFKSHCVEDDIASLQDGQQFRCTLCRFGYWPKASLQETVCSTNNNGVDSVMVDTIKIPPIQQTIGPTGNKRKRSLQSRNKPKRKRSCFLYPSLTKRMATQNLDEVYCVCKKRYKKSERMWCCDICNEWFHPRCIGRDDDEVPPKNETSFMCEPCLTEHVKEWPVQGFEHFPHCEGDDIDEDGNVTSWKDEDEDNYIRTEDVKKHMGKAYQRCWYIVRAEGSKSTVPWIKRHMLFRKLSGAVSSHGFGEALFSMHAIYMILGNLQSRFLEKKTPVAVYSLHRVIATMANEELNKLFDEDIGMSSSYISNVLLKEAMVVIMQEATQTGYDHINEELLKTEDSSHRLANMRIFNYMGKARSAFADQHTKHH